MNIFTELASLEAQGVVVWPEDGKLKYVVDGNLTASLQSKLSGLKQEAIEVFESSEVIPLELNGLQQAYWFGENEAFSEHTPAFLHLIFDGDFPSEEKMQAAMMQLILRHPPLGYSICGDAPIFELKCATPPKIEYCKSLLGHTADVFCAIDIERPILGKFGTGAPLFRLVMVDDGRRVCLHGIFRLALFDAFSITLAVEELLLLAHGADLADTTAIYQLSSFREYEFQQKRQRLRAKQYWTKKVALLPGPAKSLLLLGNSERSQTVDRSFVEHRHVLDAEHYRALKLQAKTAGVSINAVLITCYLSTLTRWNEAIQCCASVMYSQRHKIPDQHATCIGNFGALLLLGAPESDLPFKEKARIVQADLFQAMANSAYDGVSVIRDWTAQNKAMKQAGEPPMPFVFSTQIGNALRQPKVCQIGHRMMTPQVWIDAQVFENGDDLVLSWDELEGSLPEGFVADMMAYFSKWLTTLAEDIAAWNVPHNELTSQNLFVIEKSNATGHSYPSTTLVENLLSIATTEPDRIAFWHGSANLSFGELFSKAALLAQHLCENGVGSGDNVIVCGKRSPKLIIAMYAVILASGTYVPVSPQTPAEKVKRIIGVSAATTILADCDEMINTILSSPVVWTENYNSFLGEFEDNETIVELTYPINSKQLAYIIFTSGSTGVPKGVAITHEAAANTLLSCKRVFDLNSDDRILAVSEVNFDLSVFDVFMPALIGCSTILPEDSEISDPAHWLQAACKFEATVWNSVPAILHMAVTYAEAGVSDMRLPASMRLFMVSGDWIPLDLSTVVKKAAPKAIFAALGGATEASIWSNYFIVEGVDPTWRSIPYGRPLDNQRFYILDRFGELCPQGVAGKLHIAGIGLAKYYFNDDAQTQENFFEHPELQQRLYNTGDLGRYLPSGEIEFLGRDDHQIQINGFRVELSEIEHIAQNCDLIDQAIALYSPENDGLLHLVYVAHDPEDGIEQVLLDHLKAQLSHYMVPDIFHQRDQLPLSQNGKIDRKHLKALVGLTKSERSFNINGDTGAPSLNDRSIKAGSLRLLECVQLVLPYVTEVHQNWFHSGCSSLDALYVLQNLNKTLGLRLELSDIYHTQTVDVLADLVFGEHAETDGNIVWLNKKEGRTPTLVVFVHPVGGSIACYMEAADALRSSYDVIAICADEPGEAESIIDLATDYHVQIETTLQSYTSVVFAGWSFGGIVALEMARIAKIASASNIRVVTIDSFVGKTTGSISDIDLFDRFIVDIQGMYLFSNGTVPSEPSDLDSVLAQRYMIFVRNYRTLERYTPTDTNIEVVNFTAERKSAMKGLRPLIEALPTIHSISLPGDHFSILDRPAFDEWLGAIRQS